MRRGLWIAFLVLVISCAASSEPEYRFSQDFTSTHAPYWSKWLAKFKGKPVRALEIGSYEGRSTIWMWENILTHPDSSMTCLDYDSKENFIHNMTTAGFLDRTTYILGPSQETLRTLQGEFDIIYVDGCHTPYCVLTDAILSWDILRVQGVMIMDDYAQEEIAYKHTARAGIDAFLEIMKGKYKVLHPESKGGSPNFGASYQYVIEKLSGT